MLKEFKEFIVCGNVMDLVVGVIIGVVFMVIVKLLVFNLINLLIGIFLGKIDLFNLVFFIGFVYFCYGFFLNEVINFLIIVFVVFLMVKGINKVMLKKEEEVVKEGLFKEEEYFG